MKKYTAIAVSVLSVLALAGCGGISSDGFATTHTNVRHINVDGRKITCLVLTTSKGTATMSCDWTTER